MFINVYGPSGNSVVALDCLPDVLRRFCNVKKWTFDRISLALGCGHLVSALRRVRGSSGAETIDINFHLEISPDIISELARVCPAVKELRPEKRLQIDGDGSGVLEAMRPWAGTLRTLRLQIRSAAAEGEAERAADALAALSQLRDLE